MSSEEMVLQGLAIVAGSVIGSVLAQVSLVLFFSWWDRRW